MVLKSALYSAAFRVFVGGKRLMMMTTMMMHDFLSNKVALLPEPGGGGVVLRKFGTRYRICPVCETHLVKATSVIFLLGVGSLVCYKLYSHYRKKLAGPPPKKRLRLLRWGSEELIESNADLDSDLQNIETKYFGPEETNTEDITECSEEDADDCLSFLESPSPGTDNFDETLSELSDSDLEMGNLMQNQYEPVVYNVHEGINFSDDVLAGDFSSVSPRFRSKASFIPGRQRYHRKCRRFDFGALLDDQKSKDAANASNIEAKLKIDSNLKQSLLSTPEEYQDERLHSQNGSDADIESLGSPSLINWDSDLDDILGKESLWNQDSDTASLNANFSLCSLQERASIFDRLPPDGADSQPLHENCTSEVLVGDGNPEFPFKDRHIFRDNVSGKNTPEMFSSRKGSKGCLVRDYSFDSDASEISLDFSVHDNIGRSTLANIDSLLSNLQHIKQSCLNLDDDIVNLKVPKKSTSSSGLKSSVSEFSDLSGSAMEMVETYKCRASFKGLLESSAFVPELSDKSSDPSGAEVASVSSGLRNGAGVSLEWESPVLQSSQSRMSNDAKSNPIPQEVQQGILAVDSGSDFGTSLTSESPDLNSLRLSNSSPSLEWDEEFNAEDSKEESSSKAVQKSSKSADDRSRLYLPIKGTKNQEYPNEHSDLIVSRSEDNQTPVLQMLIDLTPSIGSERIIPGQSRECSPGDIVTLNKESLVCGVGITIPAKRSVPSWAINVCQEHSSFETLKGSPPCITDTPDTGSMNGPQWASTESGFGDDSGVGKNVDSENRVERRKHVSEERNANRDSAYFEDGDINLPRFQENIGDKWDIVRYCETEWRGHTSRAATIRQGYMAIPDSLGCNHFRRIRGDNYCAIRASLFQVLSHKLPLLNKYGGVSSVLQKLEFWVQNKYSWLTEWSFGCRLPYSKDTCIQGFHECLNSLDKMELLVMSSQRTEETLIKQQNSDPDLDVRLMEAVKLLMMINSINLYEDMTAGDDTPIFAILLYARESSECPKSLMINHLNLVGDSGGLEQVEMFLLGDTLGVSLQVIRPSCFGNDDYICHYPESNGEYPEVNLIAEDDRHYNIIVS